jgi:hypothetical protein
MYQVPAHFETPVQGDLNFAFDQRESDVDLHNATSLPESPSNVSQVAYPSGAHEFTPGF